MKTLITILKDNWEWRGQIANLAVFDLKKRARGAVLGWAWLIIKPIIFMFVFWFALAVGLRARSAMGGDGAEMYPYFLWLISGLVPWFFMSDMISTGSDVLHRYSYLVNKVKFPLSAISTVYTVSTLILNFALLIILMGVYIYDGMPLDVYLLQIPLIYLIMFLFWDCVSILTSQLSGMSRDFGQLMKALVQPFFWLSGILFNTANLTGTSFEWAQTVLLFNPVTFFATALRDATCEKVWIWEDPMFFGAFLLMFFLTIVLMVLVYRHFNEEVADAL